jgi:hypothetical protein
MPFNLRLIFLIIVSFYRDFVNVNFINMGKF